jgi:hypothetical protein
MPKLPPNLPRLVPDTLSRVEVQETDFAYDVLARYVCNDIDEVKAGLADGGYPFDVVVIGAGMFGGYFAEKMYRDGAALGLRILILEGGAFLLATHVQNLPQRLGGSVGGPRYLRTREDGSLTHNVVWGMPWISNVPFPGLAYCVGGRSLFWGGWSPRLTDEDLAAWPKPLREYLGFDGNPGEYDRIEEEIGVKPTADYISGSFHKRMLGRFVEARTQVKSPVFKIDEIKDAPLAVQGSPPGPGLFSFDKFSSCPFLIDALRDDVAQNTTYGDVSRRIFLVPRVQVLGFIRDSDAVTRIQVRANARADEVRVPPHCVVVLANGTVEATRLALDSLGVGSTAQGSPRVGNLMAHVRSNTVVRIKRSELGLATKPQSLEASAILVRGTAHGHRFHLQVTAAPVFGGDSEKHLWSMVPDIDLQDQMRANQDPEWVVITLRGIGEMEGDRALEANPLRSWIDLSRETDQWGIRRAYVNLVATDTDGKLWTAMDEAAIALAQKLAGGNASAIQYLYKKNDSLNSPVQATWNTDPPPPSVNADRSDPRNKVRDGLGTTHHEAGTLFMGEDPAASITDLDGKLHKAANVYVVGPPCFPTLGSANPSLTAFSLTKRTAAAIRSKARSDAAAFGAEGTTFRASDFAPLSLAQADWKAVRFDGSAAPVKHLGEVIETAGPYGLIWYTKQSFADFVLRVDWRVARADDNSGVYIRVPPATAQDPLRAADSQGHEIQIDERGFDSTSNTEGNSLKRTGALYDVLAPALIASRPIGWWNTFLIRAKGKKISVWLNGRRIIDEFESPRRQEGNLALQAHHVTSRVQFRNLMVAQL